MTSAPCVHLCEPTGKNPWLSRDDRSAMLFQKSDRVPELQKRTETGETRSQGEAHVAFG